MSVFELLKAGPGPSSSHTIGPMRAGWNFATLVAGEAPDSPCASVLSRVRGLRVRLLGSLSATGKGHGTDRAVLAGLMGYSPDDCPPDLLNTVLGLPRQERVVRMPGTEAEVRLPLGPENIVYGPIQHAFPYSNTLFIELLDTPFPDAREAAPGDADPFAGHILFSREYYSVGGGFLQCGYRLSSA